MHDASHSADAHVHAHGDHGIAKYVYVFLRPVRADRLLRFLRTRTLWPWHDQPAVGHIFMMAVSCTKAMLVILFFMHLKYEADWKYVLTIPASIMSMLLIWCWCGCRAADADLFAGATRACGTIPCRIPKATKKVKGTGAGPRYVGTLRP